MKMKTLLRHTANKELMLDEICESVKDCGTDYENSWKTLQKSFTEIVGVSFIGYIGKIGTYYYLQLPILEDTADIIIDILGSTLPDKYQMKGVNRNHNLRLHVQLTETIPQDLIGIGMEVSLMKLYREEGKFFISCELSTFKYDYVKDVQIASIVKR